MPNPLPALRKPQLRGEKLISSQDGNTTCCYYFESLSQTSAFATDSGTDDLLQRLSSERAP